MFQTPSESCRHRRAVGDRCRPSWSSCAGSGSELMCTGWKVLRHGRQPTRGLPPHIFCRNIFGDMWCTTYLQGPSPGFKAAAVNPDHGRRRQRSGRLPDGNASDSRTHIETWNALRAVAGRADFLYVADSKLCSRENMDYIARAGGRFVTVLPRTRLEDQEFRKWIQTHTPD